MDDFIINVNEIFTVEVCWFIMALIVYFFLYA